MPAQDTIVGLCLEPLDPLFFRDGRPFEPGSSVRSAMPLPHTLAGALRTWLAACAKHDFASSGSLPEAVAGLRTRGPWLALRGQGSGELKPLVPIPADLRRCKKTGKILRLKPLEKPSLPGWQPLEEGMRPLWHRGNEPLEELRGYLTPSGLEQYLRGGMPGPYEVVGATEEDALYDLDHRTGIGINAARLAAEKEKIYSIAFISLRRGLVLRHEAASSSGPAKYDVVFYAEAIGPPDLLARALAGPVAIPFGGEGRRAILTRVDPFKWPSAEPGDGQRPLLLLTSPGLFDRNPADSGNDAERRRAWRPSALAPKLLAAAVPGYIAFSGWDLKRRGPKPTRFAVPPGTVFYLKQPLSSGDPNEEPFIDYGCLFTEEKDIPQGWGTFLKGVWSHG